VKTTQVKVQQAALERSNHELLEIRRLAQRAIRKYKQEKRLCDDALHELALEKGVNPRLFVSAWRAAKLRKEVGTPTT
jgi:hypothetical protein